MGSCWSGPTVSLLSTLSSCASPHGFSSEFYGWTAESGRRYVIWLGGYGFQVSFQELFSFTFEIQEHDAIAELRVTGDYASADVDGDVVEPESGMNVCG